MPGGSYRHAAYIRGKDARFADAMDDIQKQINQLAKQTTASAASPTGPPPTPSQLNITSNATSGIIDAQIKDSNEINFGINYFLEWSTTPGFQNPVVIDLGASRNWRGVLVAGAGGGGTQNLFFRAFSQYWGSVQASEKVYFGSQKTPTAVVMNSSLSPTLQSSTGSGTAKGDGSQGGTGLGPVIKRPSNPSHIEPVESL